MQTSFPSRRMPCVEMWMRYCIRGKVGGDPLSLSGDRTTHFPPREKEDDSVPRTYRRKERSKVSVSQRSDDAVQLDVMRWVGRGMGEGCGIGLDGCKM